MSVAQINMPAYKNAMIVSEPPVINMMASVIIKHPIWDIGLQIQVLYNSRQGISEIQTMNAMSYPRHESQGYKALCLYL